MTLINAKDLFDDIREGDQIQWGDRDQPVTVYRHVTEDDLDGQIITLKEASDEWAESVQWGVEQGKYANDQLQGGDLITGEHTGDEFLIARGPRGGCYLIKLWWEKKNGRWYADAALYRRTREGDSPWTWENTITVERVGHVDVDRDQFDEDGHWIRHTDLDGRAIWSNPLEGVQWDHSGALEGVRTPEVTEDDDSALDTLENASEGDTLRVDGHTGTVSEVKDAGADFRPGFHVRVDTGDDVIHIRVFTDSGEAMDADGEISEAERLEG